MYRDAERKRAVASRIRQLWEESGYTEQFIADAIGVTLSGYQKQKASGGISRESLEKLAELHDVEVEWITTGRGKGPTPYPFSDDSQLDRIEALLMALAVDAGLNVEAIIAEATLRAQASEAATPAASETVDAT